MALTVYPPSEALRPFIRSLTIEETAEPAIYKVLPGTSAVMGFQFRGQLSIVAPTDTPLAASGITGLQDSFRLFRNSAGTGTLLVNFTETGASHFFNSPLHLLFNGSYSLGDFIPASESRRLEEQLTVAPDHSKRVALVERWLLHRLSPEKKDLLIEAAVARIHSAKGQLRVASLSQELYISPGRLEKRFRALVGTSPKKFAGLVRLQQLLKATPVNGDLTALAYEAGYFDQAHFIHDFTAYTGLTPADFFRSAKGR
jgi:AraC-like DNA-binding protein